MISTYSTLRWRTGWQSENDEFESCFRKFGYGIHKKKYKQKNKQEVRRECGLVILRPISFYFYKFRNKKEKSQHEENRWEWNKLILNFKITNG